MVGHVREVSPQADPTTGTYVVKVGLENPPDTMRLGATVVGTAALSAEPVVRLPGTALIQMGGKAAVWVVDPAQQPSAHGRWECCATRLTRRHRQRAASDGDRVVTAGSHALLPGQRVKLLPDGG